MSVASEDIDKRIAELEGKIFPFTSFTKLFSLFLFKLFQNIKVVSNDTLDTLYSSMIFLHLFSRYLQFPPDLFPRVKWWEKCKLFAI